MKLLMIFTGGTIGSSVKDGYISVDAENINRLLAEALGCGEQRDFEEYEIKVLNPYTILSETLDGTHIASLVKCINENISGYDGVIVCHGTDTLQYTAAALGFSFADSSVPIVLVSSNYVLDDPRANGSTNIKTAVEFITGRSSMPGISNRMRRGGVWVAYQNSGEGPALYEPLSLMPHQAYDDRLFVLKDGEDNGEMSSSEILKSGFDCKTINEACLKLKKESGVLWIKAYPGISYTAYIKEDAKNIKAILLDSYHSGTINTKDEELFELSRWAKDKDIPIYLIGLGTGLEYETTGPYEELGIKILPKMSPIAAYVFCWLQLV